MAKIKKPVFPEPEEPEVPKEMMVLAAYIPIAKMGRFAVIAIGTPVTVYTDNAYYPRTCERQKRYPCVNLV